MEKVLVIVQDIIRYPWFIIHCNPKTQNTMCYLKSR